jgi:hypothetical protein
MPVVMTLLYVAIIVLTLVGMWKAFEKAGQPGWAGIVPIYNIYVLTLMAKKPTWWVIVILLVPCANIYFLILLYIEVAKMFGKTAGFGIGLALLGPVFWPILGFGDARYLGEVVVVTMPKIPGPPAAGN